jgi:hypothetical protein
LDKFNPAERLTLSVYHWNKLYNLADNLLHHATLREDNVTVEAMTSLMVELDNIMYGGNTQYDDPDQLELDFGEERE